ncbi:hypothetical protein RRG08_019719 [Elysia crispata]|uniref:Uncharacterized protein n=1 Tax=Elysia crispata TaxID=231223 RepID=A0AAE1A9Q4_9GAST|nr:hypothetical protein RRG08_019719 [Elysia crispata]
MSDKTVRCHLEIGGRSWDIEFLNNSKSMFDKARDAILRSADAKRVSKIDEMASQLRVWLYGRGMWIKETVSALLGRKDFSLSDSQVQQGAVTLPDGRLLQVTTAFYTEHPFSSDLVSLVSEKRISEILNGSHAVILVMEINSDLSLSSFLPKQVLSKNTFRKNVVKRRGVIVVTRGDRFREAQRKGKISVSFVDWMRNYRGIPGALFEETQERCILFDNAGSEDVLNKQRDELIHMIDNRVLGGGHYTDMKFKEAELFSRELNTDLQELKQKVRKNIASLEGKSQKTETCLKHMNNQLEGLQEDLKEKTGALQTTLGNFDRDSKEAAQRLQTLETQLIKLEKNCATDSQEAAQRFQTLETQLIKLEKNCATDSQEAAQRFQTLETQLIKLEKNCATDSQEAEQRSERLEQFTELECKKVSEKAARDSQELEKQILELKKQVLQEKIERKEETQTNRDRIEGIRDSLLWERIKSLASSYPQLLHTSRIRKQLLILILLVLLLLPLLSSLWPVTSNSLKEITALDVRSDLRSYVDFKVEQAVKRIQENEKHLFGLNKTDPNNVSKIRQEMTEQFTEVKERLLNEIADLNGDIKKNITGRILVWDKIESLPLSLPLRMVLTLLLLLLTTVPFLLAALLILQFLLSLVLLGV